MSREKEAKELLSDLFEVRFRLKDEIVSVDDDDMLDLLKTASSPRWLKGGKGGKKRNPPKRYSFRKDIEEYVTKLGYPKLAVVAADIMSDSTPIALDNHLEPPSKNGPKKLDPQGTTDFEFTPLMTKVCDVVGDDSGEVGAGEVLFSMLTGIERVKGDKQKTDVGIYSLKSFVGKDGKIASAKLGAAYSNASSNTIEALSSIFKYVSDKFEEKGGPSSPNNDVTNALKAFVPNTLKALSSGATRKESGGENEGSRNSQLEEVSSGNEGKTKIPPAKKSYDLTENLSSYIRVLADSYGVNPLDVLDADDLEKTVTNSLNNAVFETLGNTPTVGVVPSPGGRQFKIFSSSELEFDSLTEYRIKVSPNTYAFAKVAGVSLQRAAAAAKKQRAETGSGAEVAGDPFVDRSLRLLTALLDPEKRKDVTKRDIRRISDTISGVLAANKLKAFAQILGVVPPANSASGDLKKDVITAFNEKLKQVSSESGNVSESRVRGKTKSKKSEVVTVASAAPGGMGPNVPLGMGPKATGADRKKGKKKPSTSSTLRKNALSQGKFWGGAKPVNEATTYVALGKTTAWYAEEGGIDIDGDGDTSGYEDNLGTDQPVYRGGGGNLTKQASTTGRAFGGAEPIEDLYDLLGELLPGRELTPAQTRRFKRNFHED